MSNILIKDKKAWGELEVLGAPYGGVFDGKDETNEYFSDKTDFMINIGDKRPVVYYHGLSPDGKELHKPEVIGIATCSRKDDKGLWFSVQLDKAKELAKRIWEAAKNGIARASSGSIHYLVRTQDDGEIRSWPFAELTLVDEDGPRRAANELAVVGLKAIYKEANLNLPEVFTEGAKAPKAEPVVEKEKPINESLTDIEKEIIIQSSAKIGFRFWADKDK